MSGKRIHEDVTLGAFSFGLVVGWITATTLQHLTNHGVSDIAAVVAAIGGAAVSKMFTEDNRTFGNYCLGLAGGFFVYIILYAFLNTHPLFTSPIPTPIR